MFCSVPLIEQFFRNPGGIRFGSAELYDVIDAHFSDDIQDCLAVGQSIDGGTDERVILFVKLHEGQELSTALMDTIRTQIRSRRTPRHVPSRIIQVDEIPYTLNGKRVEVLVKKVCLARTPQGKYIADFPGFNVNKIINGAPVSSVNPATLLNPQCLQSYVDIGIGLRNDVPL